MKILIIEDDKTMRSVLRTLLEIDGHEVVSYYDLVGELDMFQVIQQTMPGVILLDVHLRNFNGLDLLHQIRVNPSLDSVRVIMTSGMPVKENCLSAGANAFLLKPYMPDELLKLIQG